MIFTSTFVVVPAENVDTDQIIPARYLKTTDKVGLGAALFADWPNKPDPAGARVLVAGNNFGCGSSREHAPWALLGAGFQAVISSHFADIFTNNALKNGLLPVAIDARLLHTLFAADRDATVTIDLAAQCVTLPDGTTTPFPIDPFAKHCLVHGVDQLGFLLAESPAIDTYESTHPARVVTTGAHI
ncbi:MAG TPA: 3-isopropylmalate dehydratase small subunit [Gemmatimonadaceae bacterium]|jgi:3-isopropylmalate/(R)-2-methylmalate dehydratase small subunit|nr:3-isopropylmalate dehydratase small subunit [Gemmatimonadaceae bacterium]